MKTPSFGAAALVCVLVVSMTHAQPTADQLADQILMSARKARNERIYAFAVERYREFLQKFGSHPSANAVRLELVQSLLDGPDRGKNASIALEAVQPLLGNANLPEHGLALFYAGLARRTLGTNELAEGLTKPAEMPQRRQNAAARFAEAVQHFAAAVAVLTKNAGKSPAVDALPSIEWEWALRARAEQAEMELRLGKAKDALATIEPIVQDPAFARSVALPQALYIHGFASLLLPEPNYRQAGASLSRLAPFDHPIYCLHARFLLGRVHHARGDFAEARLAYEAVRNDYEIRKKSAAEALQRPDQFRNDPNEKARLEALVRGPAPEFIATARFQLACLLADEGQFPQALVELTDVLKLAPNASWKDEAQLRVGVCLTRNQQFGEALTVLAPLLNHPRLNDQAYFWTAKAQLGQSTLVDPMKPQERTNLLSQAAQTFRAAADRSNALIAADPDARRRRGEAFLEAADLYQQLKQPGESINLYQVILNEKLLPSRVEEVTHRLANAIHLSGDYVRSDQLCMQFQRDFPRSPLRAAIAFLAAENAYFLALAADKNPNFANRATELPKLYDTAAQRYEALLTTFPEFERVQLARFGKAMCAFRKGDFDAAAKELEAIPPPERKDLLATTPYLLAECNLRGLPLQVEDALAAGMLVEKVEKARGDLEGFIAANPTAPELPDALLKLGYCFQRLAGSNEDTEVRNRHIASARGVYDKLIQQFPQSPEAASAVFEKAKCSVLLNQIDQAIGELDRFQREQPLADSANGPYACILAATLRRRRDRAEEAARLLGEARGRYEPKYTQQPELIALLRYHHGLAVLDHARRFEREGKFPEMMQRLTDARGVFDAAIQAQPGKTIAVEAILRIGQCRLAEGKRNIDKARETLSRPESPPAAVQEARQQLQTGLAIIAEAAQLLEQRAEEFKQTLPNLEARARMYYDAAWCRRLIADQEIRLARENLQAEERKQMTAEAMKQLPKGSTPPELPVREIPLASIPVQAGEKAARGLYTVLIAAFPDLPLSVLARMELAELLAERGEHAEAVKLLRAAIDKEPPAPEPLDRLRLRLATSLAAMKEFDAARAQLEQVVDRENKVAARPISLKAEARLRLAEVFLAQANEQKAIEALAIFREQQSFRQVPGIGDRSLLRLGELLGRVGQWDASRQTLELLTREFPGSPWFNDGLYGIGWSLQKQGQYDAAVGIYQQLAARTLGELGAKAHLQIGLCRLEQKRYAEAATALLIVPYSFDLTEFNPMALTEAARALVELKQPEQARRLLERALKEAVPGSEWSKVAHERLSALDSTPDKK